MTNELFQIVIERNAKLITSGAFVIQAGLKNFLKDLEKNSSVFDRYIVTFLKSGVEQIYNLKQIYVKSFVTYTSSRCL